MSRLEGEGGGGGRRGGAHVAWVLIAHLRSVVHRVHFLVITAGSVKCNRNKAKHNKKTVCWRELQGGTVERVLRIDTCKCIVSAVRAAGRVRATYCRPHVDQPLQLQTRKLRDEGWGAIKEYAAARTCFRCLGRRHWSTLVK